ncbi:MAG: hypothetical protein IPO56_16490 [Flavobacteriales bacterium]|nr:hypothetical protein [Flavobacteriales bacterium]
MLPSGNILLTGSQFGPSGADSKLYMLIGDINGVLDTSFGDNGTYYYYRSNYAFNEGKASTLLADGRWR